MVHPLLDPQRPHLFLRLFVPLGAVILVADVALGYPLGGIKGWGWIYFTILLAIGVSPYLAMPFLVACVTLAVGSRMGHEALPGQESPTGALKDPWIAAILGICALWFLTTLVVQLLRVSAQEERESRETDENTAE